MNTSIFATYLPTLLVIVGILVVLTNIIVEVLKKLTWDKMPTNVLAILVALVLTVLAFLAWAAGPLVPCRRSSGGRLPGGLCGYVRL